MWRSRLHRALPAHWSCRTRARAAASVCCTRHAATRRYSAAAVEQEEESTPNPGPWLSEEYMGVTTIDSGYALAPTAVYMLRDQHTGAIVFVDNNTELALPRLLEAVAQSGGTVEDVKWLVVTHAHLDHSAGTAQLLEACPNATVLAHPRACRHLINPERLVAGARQVFGEDFDCLFGEVKSIDAPERVVAVEDGTTLSLELPCAEGGGTRTAFKLQFLHTRGHAKHHMCVWDESSKSLYAGDSFGVSYPSIVSHTGNRLLLPSTSPVDFEPDEAIKSIDLLVTRGADRVYLGHYGYITDLSSAARQLRRGVRVFESLAFRANCLRLEDDMMHDFLLGEVTKYARGELERCGVPPESTDKAMYDLEVDLELNARGIACFALRERHAQALPHQQSDGYSSDFEAGCSTDSKDAESCFGIKPPPSKGDAS